MRWFVSGVAAAWLAAGLVHAAEGEPTPSGEESTIPQAAPDPLAAFFAPSDAGGAQAMFFSGMDIWHTGGFVHGGLLWSPGGIMAEGFTLKLLAGAGTYRYIADAPIPVQIKGKVMLGSIMPGWRFKANKFELTVYAGPDVQDHRLSPNDPGNKLKGTHFGVRGGADLWYEPLPAMMLAASVSISSIGPNYWTRVATGWRVLDAIWLGPEALALGGPEYQQWRVGMHVTSFKTGAFEWSAGVGFVSDSDGRNGAYGRIGVLTRR